MGATPASAAGHFSPPVSVPSILPTALDSEVETLMHAASILSFANTGTDASPMISWTTSPEPGTACFTLEQLSDSGHWQSVQLLAAVGSAYRGASYRVPVQIAAGNDQFFRLRQTLLDGSVSFSDVLALAPPAAPARRVSVSLNLADDVLQLSLSDPQPAALKLRCGLGRTVAQAVVQGATAVLDLKAVPRGVYFLTVAQAGMEEILRVVKE